MERSIDQLIVDARSRVDQQPGSCVLDEVASGRISFWRVLAEEQDRPLTVSLDSGDAVVPIPEHTMQAVLDALIGNVFAHTPPGTWFSVLTGSDGARAWLEVADGGEGFGERRKVVRGRSGRGSTGLGLDIARRAAESTRGELVIDDRPGGGAVVSVYLGGISG